MTMNAEQGLLARAYNLLVEFQKTIDNSMEGEHPVREDLAVLLQDIEHQQNQLSVKTTVPEGMQLKVSLKEIQALLATGKRSRSKRTTAAPSGTSRKPTPRKTISEPSPSL